MSENMQHRIRVKGTWGMARGERNKKSKLTKNDVLKIRELSEDGIASSELAKKFNVTWQAISDVIRRKFWKHV